MRSLSEGTLTGLFFMQKYRFLTIAQFARIAGFSSYHAGEVLRDLERWGFLAYFGFIGIPGQGKTPKCYYLKRKGFDVLHAESEFYADLLDPFCQVQATWTPHMYHRLRTIDIMLSAELAIRNRPHLAMVKVLLEHKMRKKGGVNVRETTDFVAEEEITENKLVPDSVFIMENTDTKRRALFFIEMDMGTERITSKLPREHRVTLHYKLSQYDRYLTGFRFAQTYAKYGEFKSFTLLFITLSAERLENIRRNVEDLPANLTHSYRFTTFEQAMGDLFSPIWKSRLLTDLQTYPLVREG